MCKWHKHSMKEAATDPNTGEFDAGKYAVGLSVMGMLRIEQEKWRLSDMFAVDGFNPEELLTDDALSSFQNSPVSGRDFENVRDSLCKNIEVLRGYLDDVARVCDLSLESLNITDRITKDGFKKSCCAPADPRQNGPFLDAAVVYLYEGYDDASRDYASHELSLIPHEKLADICEEIKARSLDENIGADERAQAAIDLVQMQKMDALHQACEYFLSIEGARQTLENAFADTIAYLFMMAEDDLKNGRGLAGPSNCIMCEGTRGRDLKPL